MKITKKELFKFCDENNDAINELQSQSDSTDFLLAVLIQQLKDSGVIDEISPEPKPRLKQLDQSIFDGLDEKWRFAAVDADGSANGFDVRVYPRGGDKYGLFAYADDYANSDDNSIRLGEGYDASNWQNSLIERDIAKELLEVDLSSELTGSELCRAMLARGDKYVMCLLSDMSHAGALSSSKPRLITNFIDGMGFIEDPKDLYWHFATPINNQGEPLTASEVGL